MFQFSIQLKKFILFLLVIAFLYSCAANSKFSVSPYPQNITLSEDFTIEGKFKIKINKNLESGYFNIKKEKTSIVAKFGKNYLLPEREFSLQQDSTVLLSELVHIKGLNIQEEILKKEINISFLIEALLGRKEINQAYSWVIDYPEGVKVVDGFKVPSKILISYNNLSFELILKKMKRI